MIDNREFIYTVPSSILFDSTLTAIDLKIYMIIRSFMDTTGKAYPTNKWIAEKLKIYPRSVPRSIEKLITKGYLLRWDSDGTRYLLTGFPAVEPVDNLGGGCQPGHGGGVVVDMGGDVISDTQLYQRSITSNIINDHVIVKKMNRTTKTEKALSNDERHMYERLLSYNMSKSLALKLVSQNSIAIINNIIEAARENKVKNMGAYINISIKNLADVENVQSRKE